jgi:heme-degrading monooxygenase HmoA
MTYLRMTVAEWDIDLDTPEGHRLAGLIRSDGLAVFRRQPGFIRYRLMRAGPGRSIAVAEWESEALGMAGAAKYREWLETAGIKAHITMATEAGPVLVSSDPEGA